MDAQTSNLESNFVSREESQRIMHLHHVEFSRGDDKCGMLTLRRVTCNGEIII